MPIKDTLGSPSFKIAKSSLPIIVVFYIGLTIANFIILLPKGILAKTIGIGGAYQTNVMSLFSDRQIIMFYISVACGVLITCTAEVISSIKTK